MERYDFDPSYLVATSTGSQGSQIKYKYKNKWFKVDTNGYEGTAEVLASDILEASNYRNFVKYHKCIINGRTGCYSENFLMNDEQLVTFEKLYYLNTGKSLLSEINKLESVSERIQFTKSMVQSYTGISVDDYVDTCISLDYLIRNGDRHLNNLTVILGSDGYREAPIFDNGDAFFSNFQKFGPWLTMEECLDKCTAKPFSGSFDMQFLCIRNVLRVDYSLVKKLIVEQASGRCAQSALFLLDKYRNAFDNGLPSKINAFSGGFYE